MNVKAAKLPNFKAVVLAAGGGVFNRIGNLLLLFALVGLSSSVQYSFLTGGVMIVSTVIAALAKQKPSRREILSVALAFIGILALVFLDIKLFKLF